MIDDREGRELPRLVCGASLVVLLAALPVAMSLSTPRGFVLIKFAVGLPLACLAAIAAAWVWWSEKSARSLTLRPGPAAYAAFSLAIIVVVSATQADAWQQAMLGGYFRLEGALAWLAYLAVFFATRTWIRSGGAPRHVIDAILVSSIAPACYAIEQRFGLDFVTYGYGDPTRSSGTMGNPIFMGAFLAMCIPLLLVRVGMTGTATSSRWMLGAVGALQVGGLLASGSRGPLVGLLAALVFLACVRAHGRGSRLGIVGLVSTIVAAGAFVVGINTTETGRAFAKEVPTLVRLVYDPQGADPASKSIQARLAMWTAAEESLREAPWWRLMTGYGPDVAHEHFYAFMPAAKIRAEDFRREQVFDRVHADLLDTFAALGLAGLAAIGALFATALHGVARRVFGCTSWAAWASLAAAAGGAVLAWLAGASTGAARWPLAGAGLVFGWLIAIAIVAWRGRAEPELHARDDRLLMAGAGAALVAFWIDAQVGLPVFVTRLCFFVLLALAITPAQERSEASGTLVDRVISQAAWVVACAAALLSFIPAFGAGRDDGLQAANLAQALPVLALLVLGRCLGCPWPRQRSAGVALKLAALLGVVAVLALLRYHVALPAAASDWLHARTAVDAALPALLWLCPFAVAWVAGRAGVARHGGPIAGFVLASMLGMLVTAWPAWHLMVASLAHAGITQVDRRQTETRVDLQRAAVDAAPWEWQHRDGLVEEALAAGLKEVLAGLPTPASAERYRRYVEIAESTARGGLVEGSVDPWRPFLIGIALHAQGLSVLAITDPEGVARASDEADRWLGESHRLFPVHPRILEQWITLKLDRGEVAATLRLIDQLETVIPKEPDAYLLRIKAGNRFVLPSQIERAIDDAKVRLGGESLKQVLDVAD
jgi:hypothetical protein